MKLNRVFTILLLTIVGITSCKKEPNLKLPETGSYVAKSDVFPYVNHLNISKEDNIYKVEFYETKNGTKKCTLEATGKESVHGIELNSPEINGATILIRKEANGILAGPKGPEVASEVFTFCDSNRTPAGLYQKNDSTKIAKTKDIDFYSEFSIDAKKAEEVETFLREKVYDTPGEVEDMEKSNRKFQFYKIDLNDDGKEETFVRPVNNQFCGSGGCTFFLLDSNNNLINRFTVSRAPFFVEKNKVNGWRTILVHSNGGLRLLEFKNGKYPSNPSRVSLVDFKPSGHAEIIFDDDNYPAKTYKF
ncbi:hypothetical protein [Polaribacter cellanae]|uniref:Lipoprotein n=1 Tax=Polaribacter cellanae TaxID=2818493 RepID=A0A975CST5_9FLAO|nr:hypothetical protein [Polaribacter cellanae]QTE24309.1 hypothetical protein J3359_08630 [Polaribacter cellanae]